MTAQAVLFISFGLFVRWIMTSLTTAINSSTTSQKATAIMVAELTKIVIRHDAHARGIDLADKKDAGERYREAREAFKATQASIDNAIKTIREL